MHLRARLAIIIAAAPLTPALAQSVTTVVADSLTHEPLAAASVFDRNGTVVGLTDSRGHVPLISARDYPVTVRYLGYYEHTLTAPVDTVFLTENATVLPEVTVDTHSQMLLHTLAYVREYSTLTSYTDTVFLFREKMVDFMLDPGSHTRFKGWSTPRILNSKSYYRFSNSQSLDSVSSEGNYHFSWSDWIGITSPPPLPSRLCRKAQATDTIQGKYMPTEIWTRNDDRIAVDINVLADTTSRRWVPKLASFFHDDLEFERFRLRINYSNVINDTIGPSDITGYSFSIESNGRGRQMFRFAKKDEPFYVSTYCEVYILDREYISVKEAKRWAGQTIHDEIIMAPDDAPELSTATLALIDRVNNIDKDKVRLSYVPDHRYICKIPRRNNFSIPHRALTLLKDLTGITAIRAHSHQNNNWKEFTDSLKHRNRIQK